MPIKKNHVSNKMNFSSIVNEVIRIIFFMKIFYTQKKPYKAPKQRLLRYSYTPKSIIKHTGDFHLNITPKSIKKKQATFYPDIFIRLKKMHKNSGS